MIGPQVAEGRSLLEHKCLLRSGYDRTTTMRTLLLVFLCTCAVWGDIMEYDNYDEVSGGVPAVATPPSLADLTAPLFCRT